MSFSERENLPQVALDFMNSDHAEAARLIARLEALTGVQQADSYDRSAIAQALQALVEHTRAHFAHEEREMQRTGFPALSCHAGEHERVLGQMEQVHRHWHAAGDVGHLREYVTLLPHWLLNHIATMDTVTADFISRQSSQASR
jgi:hemerythrin